MIQYLTDLPKLIDAFISGVIEFCYRFFRAVIIVSRHPLDGARELEANEDQLSSRTMLFCAVALFIVGVFFSFTSIGSLAGTGFVHFFVMVIAAYVMFDGLAAFGSRYCEKRTCSDPCDKVRDFLRYGFAASLMLVTLGATLIEALDAYTQSLGPNPAEALGLGWAAGLLLSQFAIVVIMLPAFYHPISIVIGVIGRGRTRLRRALAVGGFATLLTIGAMSLLTLLLTSYGRVRDLVDGSLFVTPAACIATPEGVRVIMVIENASASATHLSRGTLKLRLSYGPGGGETVDFASLEGDAVIVEARENAKVVAEARPVSPAYAQFVASGRTGECQLEKGITNRRYELGDVGRLEPAAAAITATADAAEPAT